MIYTVDLHCPSCAALYAVCAPEPEELTMRPCDFCGAHLAELGIPLYEGSADENEPRIASAPWQPA